MSRVDSRAKLKEHFERMRGISGKRRGKPIKAPERTYKLTIKIDKEIRSALELVVKDRAKNALLKGTTDLSRLDCVIEILLSDIEIRQQYVRSLQIDDVDFVRQWKTYFPSEEPRLGIHFFSHEVRILLLDLVNTEVPWGDKRSPLLDLPGRLNRSAHGKADTDGFDIDPYLRIALELVAEARTSETRHVLGRFPRLGDAIKYSLAVSDVIHDALLKDPEIIGYLNLTSPKHNFRLVFPLIEEKRWIDVDP